MKQLIELTEGDFKGNMITVFAGVREIIEPIRQKGTYKKEPSRDLGNETFSKEGERAE